MRQEDTQEVMRLRNKYSTSKRAMYIGQSFCDRTEMYQALCEMVDWKNEQFIKIIREAEAEMDDEYLNGKSCLVDLILKKLGKN